MAQRRCDILIFGATGFTGKYTVKEAVRLSKQNNFSWGVAGRSKERLEAVIKEFATNIDIPVVIADIKNEESLKEMAKMCRVVVNCCGPYRHYGEDVVKACIDSGTHHVDISGEPQYMERMQLQYNKAAEKAAIYVISACGFDSIPCDLGIIFTQQKFKGELNSIETYLNIWRKHRDSSSSNAVLHYGTWESAIYGLAHANELRELRTKLFPEKLSPFEPKLRPRGVIHQNSISPGWSVPFPGSDRSVAYRSQRFLYEYKKIRPIQIQTYITIRSLMAVISMACIGAIFSLLTKCKFGRNLLLTYPKFFSCGAASHEGPDPKTMENTFFSVIFNAKGWKNKLTEPTDKHTEPLDGSIITKVSGVNPGYGATCTMLMISALTVLREADRMPNKGGVLPPGAAFANTSIIEQLQNNNIQFEVISSDDE